MNLLQIRTQFIDISGRYDLATDPAGADYTDNGADFFIQAGSDWLDRKATWRKNKGRFFNEVAADIYYQTMTRCRSILGVWVNDTATRTELEKKSIYWLKSNYNKLLSAMDTGPPLYYAPAHLRAIDSTDKDNLGSFMNYILADSQNYNGIVFMPATDKAYVIEIEGLFYSDELTGDTIDNYWTIEHPMCAVWASLYILEVSYRNTEGSKDWENAIDKYLAGTDKDAVDEDISAVSQMEG